MSGDKTPDLHKPVMVQEVLKAFSPLKTTSPGSYILDGTFGRGGHTQALLKESGRGGVVVALDRDQAAIQWGKRHLQPLLDGRLFLFHANFHDQSLLHHRILPPLLKGKGLQGVVLDLGPSSPQIDHPERGFSFYRSGPLDMRMDQSQHLKASHIVNQYTGEELKNLFYTLGEVKKPGPVVRALLRRRQKQPFTQTGELAELITRHQKWRRRGLHPARPYFLALRLKVNNELEGLKEALPGLINSLHSGGRMVVISFHSLEDRIVKQAFQAQALRGQGVALTKKVIRPGKGELHSNPRARGGKLRIFEKT